MLASVVGGKTMTSRFGRKFSMPRAAEYLGMAYSELYGLVRRGAIPYHRVPGIARIGQRQAAGGKVVKFTRGPSYFFYQTELDASIERTRVNPIEPRLAVTEPPADLSAVMPAKRRFS
jgi:hypothetical protein